MPRQTSLSGMDCTIARTLDVIGQWWTLLIVRDALRGVARFEDFHRNLGLARTVLSARLDHLVAAGLMERRQYQTNPVRFEYTLTEKGVELYPVLISLHNWGSRWTSGEDGPPFTFLHTTCGHTTTPVYHCDSCGEQLQGPDIERVPRPDGPDTDVEI